MKIVAIRVLLCFLFFGIFFLFSRYFLIRLVAGFSLTWVGVKDADVKSRKCETGADLLLFFDTEGFFCLLSHHKLSLFLL